VHDLLVVTHGRHYVETVQSPAPRLMLFRGQQGRRWGAEGNGVRPDWSLWEAPFSYRVKVVDHDGDGVLDVAMFRDREHLDLVGGVSIAYGNRGGLPDTAMLNATFVVYEGHTGTYGELIDVTGDRVPELIVACSDTVDFLSGTMRWIVYVGRRGHRLDKQFGSGNDAPQPGDSLWWGRPWTSIWAPSHYSGNWSRPLRAVFECGDIGLDGFGDFCGYSDPQLVCYNGGTNLDSWIDATYRVPSQIASIFRPRITRLGNIDGSGVPTIAVSEAANSEFAGQVHFVKATPRVPTNGFEISLPTGTDRPASAPSMNASEGAFVSLSASPNPATTSTTLRWEAQPRAVSVALVDLLGRALRRWVLPAGADELRMTLDGLAVGRYYVLVTAGGQTVSTLLFVNR
jgi:hypothetical protein